MRNQHVGKVIRTAVTVAAGVVAMIELGSGTRALMAAEAEAPMLGASVFPGNMARFALRQTREALAVAPGEKPSAAPYDLPRGGRELAALYPRAAPAIVLLLAADGASGGTGFLISEDGWILTNHHVVNQSSLTDDLRRTVSVFLGDIGEFGQMTPRKERLVAEVYMWDTERDLALLKLKLPAGENAAAHAALPFLNVVTNGARVGEDVAAIGHRGIGLMWGMKPGNIIAIGRQLDNIGLMQMWENRSRQAVRLLSEVSYSDVEKDVLASMRQFRNVVLIESTCATAPGDSGGPLLNMNGEAVGIVSFGRRDDSGVSASYFIHGSEIADFLKTKPLEAMAVLPSFWEVEPLGGELRDTRKNGIPDTFILYGLTTGADGNPEQITIAQAWDLDGKPLKTPVRNPGELFEKRAFDMEMYMLKVSDRVIMAYDLNKNGKFDLVRMKSAGTRWVTEVLILEDGTRKVKLVEGETSLLLPPKSLPESWHAAYARIRLPDLKP